MLSVFQFTDRLCHRTHGAEYTPCSWLEQHHNDQTNERRGQHHTVKTKAELGCPVRNRARRICPVPGHTEGPEQFQGFAQTVCPRRYQIGLEEHIGKHRHKKYQESITEPFGRKEFRCRSVAGAFITDLLQELPSAAVTIAERLIPADEGEEKRHHKIDHPQPGKEDVEIA